MSTSKPLSLAEELCREHDLITRGTDYPDERAVSAINEAIDRCASVARKYGDESGYAHEIANEILEMKESQ